jgi:hypothetical protein
MDYRDALSAELPPPRDDEPASLRRDILDELTDHLGCAYHRELLRGTNPIEARQRVLNRFGDPAAVGRRLWLDAMKGKIMAQRIVMATCLVVTLASLSLTAVLSQQSIRAQRDAARMAVEAQVSQKEMLKQLREVSEAIRTTRSLDWNPVKFQLTEDTPEGPPAVGFLIALKEQVSGSVGNGVGQAGPEPAQRVSDRSGLADFGVVHPGDYSFQIVKSWDQGSVAASGQIHVEPGSQINQRIVCPKAPPQLVPVRVRCVWPADLETEKLVLYAWFTPNPIQREGVTWIMSDPSPSESPDMKRSPLTAAASRWPAMRSVLCGPEMSMAQVLPTRWPSIWTLNSPRPPQKIWMDLMDRSIRRIKEPAETMDWERGAYRLEEAFVLRPSDPANKTTVRSRFELVVASYSWPSRSDMSISMAMNRTKSYWTLDAPPADRPPTKATKVYTNASGRGRDLLVNPQMNSGLLVETDRLIPWESWSKTATSFEARPGQVNEWTIPLPDDLIKSVREKLKAKP